MNILDENPFSPVISVFTIADYVMLATALFIWQLGNMKQRVS